MLLFRDGNARTANLFCKAKRLQAADAPMQYLPKPNPSSCMLLPAAASAKHLCLGLHTHVGNDPLCQTEQTLRMSHLCLTATALLLEMQHGDILDAISPAL